IPDQYVRVGARRQDSLARVEAERPGRIRAPGLREPLDRQAPGQATRQEQREAGPDARDPVAVAPPVGGELPGGPRVFLAVVRAHRVEGPVRECLPQRFGMTGWPERRDHEVALGVAALVAAVIQQQVMKADLTVEGR